MRGSSKDPTPKADGLRKMREATRGHLQATATESPAKKKLIPYAGADRTIPAGRGGVPYSKNPKEKKK